MLSLKHLILTNKKNKNKIIFLKSNRKGAAPVLFINPHCSSQGHCWSLCPSARAELSHSRASWGQPAPTQPQSISCSTHLGRDAERPPWQQGFDKLSIHLWIKALDKHPLLSQFPALSHFIMPSVPNFGSKAPLDLI